MADPVIKQANSEPTGNFHMNRQFWLRGLAMVAGIAFIFFVTSKSPKKREAQPIATHVGLPSARSLHAEKEETALAPEEAARIRADKAKAEADKALDDLRGGRHGRIPGEGEDQARYQQSAPQDPIAADRDKHMWTSLFSSPVAHSYRAKEAPLVTSNIAPGDAYVEPKQKTQEPPKPTKSDSADDGKLTLNAGTVIEGVLKNGLAGEFAGPVSCMISTNVYAGYPYPVVVIPTGSTIIGKAAKVEEQDQQALAITFSEITLPNGTTLNLDELALDQGGETAVRDKVNHHYLATFGTSVALGLLGGLSLAGTQGGYTQDGGDYYRQGVSRQLGSDARQILGRQLNRLPTITIRPGHRVAIMLTKQMRIPAYTNQ